MSDDTKAWPFPEKTAKPETTALPTESNARKAIPIVRGCLDYFPAALAAVASLSLAGNEKHNPGQPMHHARGKSGDHADCIVRHLMERGTVDVSDGIRHSVKVAWRALAQLQEELEQEGAPLARGARAAVPDKTDNRAADVAQVGHCKECGSTTPSACCPECKPAPMTMRPCVSCGGYSGFNPGCADCR